MYQDLITDMVILVLVMLVKGGVKMELLLVDKNGLEGQHITTRRITVVHAVKTTLRTIPVSKLRHRTLVTQTAQRIKASSPAAESTFAMQLLRWDSVVFALAQQKRIPR